MAGDLVYSYATDPFLLASHFLFLPSSFFRSVVDGRQWEWDIYEPVVLR